MFRKKRITFSNDSRDNRERWDINTDCEMPKCMLEKPVLHKPVLARPMSNNYILYLINMLTVLFEIL